MSIKLIQLYDHIKQLQEEYNQHLDKLQLYSFKTLPFALFSVLFEFLSYRERVRLRSVHRFWNQGLSFKISYKSDYEFQIQRTVSFALPENRFFFDFRGPNREQFLSFFPKQPQTGIALYPKGKSTLGFWYWENYRNRQMTPGQKMGTLNIPLDYQHLDPPQYGIFQGRFYWVVKNKLYVFLFVDGVNFEILEKMIDLSSVLSGTRFCTFELSASFLVIQAEHKKNQTVYFLVYQIKNWQLCNVFHLPDFQHSSKHWNDKFFCLLGSCGRKVTFYHFLDSRPQCVFQKTLLRRICCFALTSKSLFTFNLYNFEEFYLFLAPKKKIFIKFLWWRTSALRFSNF